MEKNLEQELGNVVTQLRRSGEGESRPVKPALAGSHESIGNTAATAVESYVFKVDDDLSRLIQSIEDMRTANRTSMAHVRSVIENMMDQGKASLAAAKIITDGLEPLKAAQAKLVGGA